MDYLLPAATYQSPSRPVRGTVLNTIIEDQREGSFVRSSDESGTDTDEGTVIYNPVDTNIKAATTDPKARRFLSPSPERKSSPFFEHGGISRRKSSDELYDVTDDETEFSDSCASSLRDCMSSRPTSFATESDRNSVASSCQSKSRNQYPTIMIPSTSVWGSLSASTKDSSAVPPTPPPKIPVSPATLSLLPRSVPAINAPPSLDGSSMTSDRVSCASAPVTPDMHHAPECENWDLQHALRLRRDGDSMQDESDSESMSPRGEIVIEQSIDWDELGSFPRIPGATPQELSPIMPDIRGLGVLRPATPSAQGVLLPSDALQTLLQLAPEEASDLVSEASIGDPAEMWEKAEPTSRPRSADGATPSSSISDYSFSQLSIPSPGGFFSSLQSGTRHTWFPGSSKQSNPPSSTTAENFYNAPWHRPQNVVEQVIEIVDSGTDGPPTARQDSMETPRGTQHLNTGNPTPPVTQSQHSDVETKQKITQSPSIRYEYEEAYESELMENAAEHLDRTTSWLTAQLSYLSALRESNPANVMSEWPCPTIDFLPESKASAESTAKKVVRFQEGEKTKEGEDGLEIGQHEEHVYYQAFQHLAQGRRRRDGFVQGKSRFEAIQASRIAMTSEHVDQLCGVYEVREPTRPEYSGPFSQNPRAAGVLDYTPEQLTFMRAEREKGVLDQISPTYWMVDALKYLHGGSLLLSEASKRLASAPLPPNEPNCAGKSRMRVLDLGGNTSCDWAWHCAAQFPNVKTYTVSTSAAAANVSITGPRNHRLVVASQLWKLPFQDDHFDVVSARSLHTMLRYEAVAGQSEMDEYDACLRECYRVLKPGGHLEFMLMDSDMAHAGPLASAMSVEFGFKLKTRGYDSMPTKSFLGRLRQTNFVDVKRAWMFLPAGSPTLDADAPAPAPTPSDEAEAGQGPMGSTADVANVTGLLGSWMWEQWMLKLQMEMGVEKDKLLRGVAAVIEESKYCDAGWSCLSGWAKKPQPKPKRNARIARAPTTETIHIKMAP